MTMKGFKSFASATSFKLEPGITCVVGPNGSGKSNVVDALAWVMGEQGAKTLRGGKMEDVIFAGTAGRPPLGRAEVSLTIDNTDGALPIDYTEVTIRRTMFRNGGSEYAINGTPCRLLDVQELLSDSGIGREMHVIVGQGQLDTILRATPEERRGFIEEAAGVLKHRKRKERALRKLDQMEGNLTRVQDLTGEIRRQLGPLGRQAETARRAAVIQADARDARLRLLADDLVQLTATVEQEVADESALLARRAEVETELRAVQTELAALEQAAAEAQPELAAAQDRWFTLSSLRDRLTATANLAAERSRLLAEDDGQQTPAGRDPDQLAAEAAAVREQEQALAAKVERTGAELAAAVSERQAAEHAHQAEGERLARLVRAAADRREGLARLAGQVAARRSRLEAAEAEIGRLAEARTAADDQAASAEREFAELEGSIAVHEQGEEGLDTAYEQAEAELEEATAEVERWREAHRTAERERSAAQARLEALELGLRRKDGAAALLAAAEQIDGGRGVLGSLAALLQVEAGHETSVAAALGWASDAVVVSGVGAARDSLATLREQDAGRAGLLVAETAPTDGGPSWPALPEGARWAVDVVTVSPDVRPAVVHLLDRVALATDLDQAVDLVGRREGITAVTPDGDVFAPGFVRGGSAAAPSLIEVQAAVDETRELVQRVGSDGERAGFALATASARLAEAKERVDEALDRLHDNDATMSAVAERLGTLGAQMRSARAESGRVRARIEEATAAVETDRGELEALVQRLADAEAQGEEDQDEPSTQERDRLAGAATAARAAEIELRLTLRTREERVRALGGRAAGLERGAQQERAAREQAAARAARRRREAELARMVGVAAARAVDLVAASVDRAHGARAAGEQERAERDVRLHELRRRAGERGDELRELTDSVHRDEVARTQQRLRIEALQTKAVEELGVDPDVLVDEFGPHQPVPVLEEPSQEEPRTVPFVREEQEKRLRKAERGLSALGRVNPLALEEFAALEERHTFLTEQLEDLKRSKRDLLDIVKEVDERVERVFTEAYQDTEREFEGVFARLFPGGEGRLVLTDPDNMLTTGIDVEARPPGKKIKRLSLLSGGERSLVAVALLVAIFKARPSPFYIMDEVEAALDDANLGRLISLFEELRDSSQLIVITHQKRTMEVADALYGVTMRGDGVTTVVSQRLADVDHERLVTA
nr:chromosome segregation protein SMC [Arsenicicoccus piscis]